MYGIVIYLMYLHKMAHKWKGMSYDKWGFVLYKKVVCRVYRLYSTNLVCLASEKFMCLYGWNPYL